MIFIYEKIKELFKKNAINGFKKKVQVRKIELIINKYLFILIMINRIHF